MRRKVNGYFEIVEDSIIRRHNRTYSVDVTLVFDECPCNGALKTRVATLYLEVPEAVREKEYVRPWIEDVIDTYYSLGLHSITRKRLGEIKDIGELVRLAHERAKEIVSERKVSYGVHLLV